MLTCLRVCAGSAAASGCLQGRELGAQAAEGGIDHRIAQHRPLGFKRGDAGFELLLARSSG